MSIILKEVKKTYNQGKDSEVRALRGINLEISDGEMAAIIGASGSGKSTLLHILGCLDNDFEGEYILNGMNIKSLSGKELAGLRNKEIGIVLQNFGLIQSMSVYDNIAVPWYLGEKISKKDLDIIIENIMERIGISDKRNVDVSELSGGQKQRTAIARALIKNPKIILADEPTGALDKSTAKQIVELLSELHDDGYTVVIVTHDPEVAARCQRIIEISDGKIV